MHSRLKLLAIIGGALVAAFAASAPAAADPVIVGEEHCVIKVTPDDTLNVRAGPGTAFEILGTLAPDACGVVPTGPCDANNWCPVEDGHRAGYVRSAYIAPISPALYCVTGVAANDVLNLRAGPSPRAAILTTLPPNQCGIAFLPYAEWEWQRIRVDGWEGWVNRAFLTGQ